MLGYHRLLPAVISLSELIIERTLGLRSFYLAEIETDLAGFCDLIGGYLYLVN